MTRRAPRRSLELSEHLVTEAEYAQRQKLLIKRAHIALWTAEKYVRWASDDESTEDRAKSWKLARMNLQRARAWYVVACGVGGEWRWDKFEERYASMRALVEVYESAAP